MRELELSKEIITSYLNKNITLYGLNDLYEINDGNEKLLLEHLKALVNIFQKAIDYLEKSDK